MWYAIIFFAVLNADGSQPMYVFTEPTFKTEAECRYTLTDQESVQRYTMKLLQAYKGTLPGPIRGVNCITEELFKELQGLKEGTSVSI